MSRKLITLAVCTAALTLASCTGMRTANGLTTVHAESFRIFGFAIPSDDQEAAAKLWEEKAKGMTVTASHSTSADWTSFWGVLGNLFGLHCTSISGKSGS